MKKSLKASTRRKSKRTVATTNKKVVCPILARARSLRSSLLSRATPELKPLVPTREELQKWLTRKVYLCHYSLEELTLATLQVDHKTPVARGGSHDISNLCFSSPSMNRIKGNLTEEEFRGLLELVKSWDEVAKTSLFRRLKMGHF